LRPSRRLNSRYSRGGYQCNKEHALRLLLPALFCLVASSAAADGPFTPPGVTPPDYTVTMDVKWAYSKPGKAIVLHHGDWTRVAETADSPNVTYYLADDREAISVGDHYLSIVRGPDRPFTEYAPRNTGERQKHLGENCTVWEVSRKKIGAPSSKTSCVTDDGIELWWRSSSSQSVSSAEATRMERRPIASEDAQPPRSIFAWDSPDRDTLPPIAPEKPDHEVVMERMIGDKGKAIRTVRRHGPWQFTEEIFGKQRSIDIIHDFGQMWWRYASDEAGAPKRLTVGKKYVLAPTEQAEIQAAVPRPANMNQTDTVLGETCHWFNMTPGAADGGAWACLTEDGIALKETFWSHPSRPREWTAIRVARRPIAIDEIKPPAELLSPQTWGVE